MTSKKTIDGRKVRLYPPPPKDFDPLTATKKDLMRHGLPLRPEPHTRPGMAALWERQAAHYCGFEHLDPQPDITTAEKRMSTASALISTASALGPDPIESCGYQLLSTSAPFTALFVTWTVPALHYSPSPFGINHFQTFVGLGFLDVHVEMTVDPQQNITSNIWAQSVGDVNLPVRPGDVISSTLCLNTDPPGRANYILANETTSQTVNLTVDTGFPPAVTINAGVSRGGNPSQLPASDPLAHFGVVYFDEISAFTSSGQPPPLTSGQAITMVNQNGGTLARPVRLNDFAFKTVFVEA